MGLGSSTNGYGRESAPGLWSDLIEMGLVTLHDHPKALMLWVEPSRKGWEAVKALEAAP